MAYEFKIATYAGGVGALATLQSLGVYDPRFDFAIYSSTVNTLDGNEKGLGTPVVEWHWGFIKDAMRVTLRTYIGSTVKSGLVYIRTPDAALTNTNYLAIMHWPVREIKTNGKILDFALVFTNLIAQ